jgi:alkylation response protein AidB-like acyl-CoA dehydrogenase
MSLADQATHMPSGGSFLFESHSHFAIPEHFDSDVQLMADTAYQFARNEVVPLIERLDEQEEGLMMSLVRKACDLGFGGPDSPEAYGGLGLPKSVATRILEMLSLNGSFSTTIGVHQGVGQMPIALFGTNDLKARYLPPLTSGEYMGAYALSEEKSGSDALSGNAKAVCDGSDYVLSGTKMWISNAKWAGSFIVFAKVDGQEFTAFVVERDMPGVSISREEHKMGLKGSSTARLILDNVRVPAENVLYHPGQGHKVAFNTLNIGRCKLAAMAAGQVRSALSVGTKYAKERKQFGKPIASFGLIRDKVARTVSSFFAAESMLYRTANLIDQAFSLVDPNGVQAEENRKAAEEFQIECSLVKVFATETLSYAVDEALQIHGGYGFTEEFPVGRLYRDARVMRIYEGTNEINRVFAFDRIVKRGMIEKLADASPTSVIHEFLIRGSLAARDHLGEQEIVACASDLAMLHFASQSARARAEQLTASGHANAALAISAASHFEAIATASAALRLGELLSRCGISEEVKFPAGDFAGAVKVAEAAFEANGYPL